MIKHLYMDGNQLTGTIPSTFGNLRLLKSLDLYNNMLMGTVPSQLCSIHMQPNITIDCGEIACEYCVGYNDTAC
jgi:Leucine Rich Repeat